jgi:hypothetical protein
MIFNAEHGFSKGVVYNLSFVGDYGLQTLEEICSNLPCIERGFVFLETLMVICWIPIILGFLKDVYVMQCAYFQREERLASFWICSWFLILKMWVISIRLLSQWSDHDMIFLSCSFERSRVASLYQNIRNFRDIDRNRGAWSRCSFELEYSMVYGWIT